MLFRSHHSPSSPGTTPGTLSELTASPPDRASSRDVARALNVPVGHLIAGLIEREVWREIGAAQPHLRVRDDHRAHLLHRSLSLLRHPRVAARSTCGDRVARAAHLCATPRA